MAKLLTVLMLSISGIIAAQTSGKLKFTTEKSKNSYVIYGENEEEMPMSAVFKFTLTNMKSTLNSDEIVVIPAKSTRNLIAVISQLDLTKSYSYKYSSMYNFGDVTLNSFDKQYQYSLPFETGKTFLIYQGYNTLKSHKDQVALDFNLKVGDKIFAARGGKVVAVEEKFEQGCGTIECAKYNNKILILHSDGTFAEYLHLKQNGAEVNVGENISQGQMIGYSGNTGWSTGPHLHFAVFINRMDGKKHYIETKFMSSNSPAELLIENKSYKKIEYK